MMLPNLKGWWKDVEMSNLTTMPSFPCLSHLEIDDCPKLISMPLYPSLEGLLLHNSSLETFQQTLMLTNMVEKTINEASSSMSTTCTFNLLGFLPLSKLTILTFHTVDLQCLPESLKMLTSLKKLEIIECGSLKSLSPGIQHLSSLQRTEIDSCEELDLSSDDATMWRKLGNLRMLWLSRLPKLVALPEGIQHMTSLQYITIDSCDNLVAIMECISSLPSLRCLIILKCPELKSMPEGIECLPSLCELRVHDCPILLERCRKDVEEYWPRIRHIQDLRLGHAFLAGML